MTASALARAIARSGAELWCDGAGERDLAAALGHGATGATTNPPIVLAAVRDDPARWSGRVRAIAAAHPGAGEVELARSLADEVAAAGARILEPRFRESDGRRGRLSAQVDPRLARDAAAMVAEAERLAALGPNLQVKIPVTAAGLVALEEAVARGIEVNATANFTVSGALAVGEAIERGLGRRAAAGVGGSPAPVCTIMVGRLDDWVRVAADRDGVLLTPGVAEWAGVAVFKAAVRHYRERGYRTRLLAGAFRHHLPWTQLLGPGIVVTVPPAWQRSLEAAGLDAAARLDEPVAAPVIDELLARSPEFALALDPAALDPAGLEAYGAARRTLRAFLAARSDLEAWVRDLVVPDPDRGP